jgi:hypothetical protein
MVGDKGLFNMRAGYTRFTQQQDQTDVKQFDRSRLGFTSLPGDFLPRIDLEQYASIGVGNNGLVTADKTASLQSNYTRTFSRHVLKTGGEYRNIRADPKATGNSNGFFDFTRGFTRRDPNSGDAASGNAVASFLLGYPNAANIGAQQERGMQWHYLALFAQDDLRLTPKLTLNLGLRWDYESGATERLNRIVRGFAFDQASPLGAQVKNAPGVNECPGCADLRGGLLFAGVGGVPRQLTDSDLNNFQPRVGFAYSVNSKTVLRGGYGLYHRYRGQLGAQTGFFVDTPYIANDINGRVGVPEQGINTFENPFSRGLSEAPGASAGLLTQVGRAISFDDPASPVPYIHQWNLTLQREIFSDLMVEMSYVGSRSGAVPVSKGINEISADDLARGGSYLQATVTNPFAALLPGTSINGNTVQRQQLLRPYPQFTGITENSIGIGTTSYHALQVVVQKRVSHGLTLTSAYTYSKTKERANFLNSQDTELVEQVTDYHRPHIWVLSGTYRLPFGRGQWIGANSEGLTDHLIGGWQVQWIFNWQSGPPLGINDTTGNNLALIGSAKLDHPTPDRWFNTCYEDLAGVMQKCEPGESPAWRQISAFALRTTPNRFDDIQQPWKPTLDASLFKNLQFSRRWRMELRLEAFNVMNSVIYPAPNTNYTSANFGKIAVPRGTIYFPRNVQLGAKLYF